MLLTRRDDDGLSHWLIAPDAIGVQQSALHLAQTVAARAVELVDDIPELFESKHIAVASRQVRSPKVKTDTREVAVLDGPWSGQRFCVCRTALVHELFSRREWTNV